jgi:hypothetical protein
LILLIENRLNLPVYFLGKTGPLVCLAMHIVPTLVKNQLDSANHYKDLKVKFNGHMSLFISDQVFARPKVHLFLGEFSKHGFIATGLKNVNNG